MKYLDVSFTDPAMNLACDEWLLERAETGQGEYLRVWESSVYFVVLGRAKKLADDVLQAACDRAGVPILRRASGGGTVLQGPGCLNYALVLDVESRRIENLRAGFEFVLTRHSRLVSQILEEEVEPRGISDLTVASRKISGNAQYRKRRFTLVHGTFLLNFDIGKCEKLLTVPADRPAYRADRTHREFLANIGTTSAVIKKNLQDIWDAQWQSPPGLHDLEKLALSRYSDIAWTKKF